MKTLLVLYGLLALTWTLHVPIPQQDENKPSRLGDVSQQSLHKQQIVLNLLQNINQPGSVPEVENVGLTYDIEANVENYKNPQVVVQFFKLYTTVALPKGQAFSIFNEQQRKEAIAFFRILQNAVDFDTLYKTAAWGTMFLNEGLYIYALSVALVHRQDTWTIRLPPIYEIYPSFFYNGGVLQQIEQVTGIPVGGVGVQQQLTQSVNTYQQVPIQQGVNQHQHGQFQIQLPVQTQGGLLQNQQGSVQNQQGYIKILGLIPGQQGFVQNQPLVQEQQGVTSNQQEFVQNQQRYVNLLDPIQSQQGFVQNQPLIQRQQGVNQQGYINLLGPIQTQQGLTQPLVQRQLGLSQGQQGLTQSQLKYIQDQLGLIQGQPVQGEQALVQIQPGSIQGNQGLVQNQLGTQVHQGFIQNHPGPILGQRGLVQNQQGIQGQQGLIQNQPGSVLGHEGLVQNQLGVQGQQGFIQNQPGPILGQEGLIQSQLGIQGEQGLIQNQPGSVLGQEGLVQNQLGVQGHQGFTQNQPGSILGQEGLVQNQLGIQGQQGLVQNQPGSLLGQEGLVQNQLGVQGQQGFIQNQPGSILGQEGLVQNQLGIQGQQGSILNQQGVLQNQLGSTKWQQGHILNQRAHIQNKLRYILNQLGLLQNQADSILGQEGLVQNQLGVQGEQGLIQNQPGSILGQKWLVQIQPGIQSQQPSISNQQGLLQNQLGSTKWQQGPVLDQHVPIQGKLRYILNQLGLLQGLIKPQLAQNQGVFQIQQRSSSPQLGLGLHQNPQIQSLIWQRNVPYSVEYLQQYGRAPYVAPQVEPQYLLGGLLSHNSMNVQNAPHILQQYGTQTQTGSQIPIVHSIWSQVIPSGGQGPQVVPHQIQQQQAQQQQQVLYGLNLQQNIPFQQVPIVAPGVQNLGKLVVINPKTKVSQEREKLQIEPNSIINGVIIDDNQVSSQQTVKSILSYFTEDVGLNAFYYYYNIYFPFWMTNEEISFNTERRGEQFYYICQQLLGRYNLERISNGLPEVPLLDMKTLTSSGYQSEQVNLNGALLPLRPENTLILPLTGKQVYDNDTISLKNLDLYETRLLDAIDSGFVLTRKGEMVPISTPQDFEVLGNVIQTNAESPNVRYYGNILGVATNVLKNIDSAHSETSLHDTVFYQLLKKITYYFQRYQEALPVYTEEQLLLPGVKIQDVAVDQLVTYFDSFYTDVSGVVGIQGNSQNVPVQVKQTRLNHQPFNYYLNVLSEQPTEAVVKVFLGPKNDLLGNPIDINKNRLNFVELDKFQYSLVPGLNTIARNCKQFIGYIPDQTTTKKIFAQLINFQTPIQNVPNVEWGIPHRLLLPKGIQEGQTYQMYVIITSSQSTLKPINRKVQLEQPTLYWDVIPDGLPLGFPLDRPIDESVFYVPNSSFQDVVVYNDVNPTIGSTGQIEKENQSLS